MAATQRKLAPCGMATFTISARLFEVVGFAPVHEPGYHYECYELAPDGRGELGRIVVPADDGPDEVEFRFLKSVELSVLEKWISFVPQLAGGIMPSAD